MHQGAVLKQKRSGGWGRALTRSVGGVLVLGAAAAGAWLWNPLPSNPGAAVLSAAASQYDVTIYRDNWNVPHISGKLDADASFGLAYAHAEDDFDTIQTTIAATRGVLARYNGPDATPTDYLVAMFDIWGTTDRGYADDVPADVKAIAEAYAAGLNIYAAENPDATWQGLAPFTGQDVIAGFMFKSPFFYGLDKTLLSLFGDERNVEMALDPSANRQAWHVGPKTATELGSNGMAVSAARSGDDTTRLFINSHQPLDGPVAWYEAHLMSEEGLDITGGIFPGTPVILHGFNRSIGWANTVNAIDLADVYVLTRNPENPMQYKLDGKWVDFSKTSVTIEVRLFGPFAFMAERTVLRSKHGPVIQAADKTYALRYANMGEIRQLEQYYRLNQAQNLDEFLDAMALGALPSINYIYADKDNNIGFIHNAQYPNRDEAWDWSKDLPGDRSDLIWQGYRPFSEVPKLINPASGFVYNSNNTPFVATDGADNLRAQDFPQSMGLATNHTNRSLRVAELTDGTSLIGREELLAIKFDVSYSKKSKYAAVINRLTALDWSAEPEMAAAADHLRAWNLSADAANLQAALGVVTMRKNNRLSGGGDTQAYEADAFRWTVEYLKKHHGKIDPPWGDVSRLVRGDVNMPLDGGPDTLRAVYSIGEFREDGIAPITHGDTWIALVEWDATGKQSADLIHQYGSATLDATSQHYADQAPLFATKKWRKALLDIEDIKAQAKRTYRPGKK
ncbi:MAG: hypothetical protein COB37_12135 [Kordiimonadales bacterium]|nr:MAG: hypothetical protein COB37_12135 [Kordiimonadales bacterium]